MDGANCSPGAETCLLVGDRWERATTTVRRRAVAAVPRRDGVRDDGRATRSAGPSAVRRRGAEGSGMRQIAPARQFAMTMPAHVGRRWWAVARLLLVPRAATTDVRPRAPIS